MGHDRVRSEHLHTSQRRLGTPECGSRPREECIGDAAPVYARSDRKRVDAHGDGDPAAAAAKAASSATGAADAGAAGNDSDPQRTAAGMAVPPSAASVGPVAT